MVQAFSVTQPRQKELVATWVILPILSTTVVALRLFAKRKTRVRYGWAEWWILASAVSGHPETRLRGHPLELFSDLKIRQLLTILFFIFLLLSKSPNNTHVSTPGRRLTSSVQISASLRRHRRVW